MCRVSSAGYVVHVVVHEEWVLLLGGYNFTAIGYDRYGTKGVEA